MVKEREIVNDIDKRKISRELKIQLLFDQARIASDEISKGRMEFMTFVVLFLTFFMAVVSVASINLMSEMVQTTNLSIQIMPWVILIAYITLVVFVSLKWRHTQKREKELQDIRKKIFEELKKA